MKDDPKHIDQKLKEAGYKFLGWQNGWASVYLDKDGKITTGDLLKGENPKVSSTYIKEDYPEYSSCREKKHNLDDISHNNRGSENTVSCDVCKIFWKYDCSD